MQYSSSSSSSCSASPSASSCTPVADPKLSPSKDRIRMVLQRAVKAVSAPVHPLSPTKERIRLALEKAKRRVEEATPTNEWKETRQQIRATIARESMEVEEPESSSMDEEESEDETAVIAKTLFPVSKSPPSYATFYRSRWDARFRDVVTRPKHFHCRCPTCFELQANGTRHWLTKEHREEHTARLQAHQREYTVGELSR